MSRSYRDKKGFKARNPEKYIEGEISGDSMFKNGLYPTKDFPKIAWAIQGRRRWKQKFQLDEVKKVKLFLCSYYKDGEMLPKFEGPGGYTYEIQHNQQYDGKKLKVIGEISKDAVWAKEGDEFDEEEWEYAYKDSDENPSLVDKEYFNSMQLTSRPDVHIVIKCPNCKTFH